MTGDASSAVLQLKAERAALEPLNRTVRHCLCLASDRELLAGAPRGQHARRVPSTWGLRRDAFFWDSWDWKLRGEDDLRQFFEIAERIGSHLGELEETEASNLLPGTFDETVGRRTKLFLPDYWLLVVHFLGWTDQLPYECDMRWRRGRAFDDRPFCVTSSLPVNVVQASIDALTVLIDAVPHRVWDSSAGRHVMHQPDAPVARPWHVGRAETSPGRNGHHRASATVESRSAGRVLKPRLQERRSRKRAERAANIELLRKELIEHIRAARDHAQAAIDFGREPELLPRPSRRDLAERAGINEAAVSRCFNDPAATELNVLWNTAEELEAVMKFVRH